MSDRRKCYFLIICDAIPVILLKQISMNVLPQMRAPGEYAPTQKVPTSAQIVSLVLSNQQMDRNAKVLNYFAATPDS